jgi:CubicO group peptidase (beta-lactamase class C family)
MKIMKWAIVILLLLGASACHAQSAPSFTNAVKIKRLDGSTISTAEIDATVTRVLAAGKVTGAGIVILNDNKVVFQKGYGFRDVEKSLPLTPDTVMTAASLTKSTFAYMVMQLVQEGVLDLDKPVYQYLPKPLPEYENYKDLAGDDRYKKITSRMLLDHSPGFPNWRQFTDDGALRIFFEPGARYAYSGEGIYLLQLVVESITHKPIAELMQERVFAPLGMSRTSMIWQSQFESNFANGYDENGKSLGPQHRTHANAAGSMLTTPADWSKLLEAILENRGLKIEIRDAMLSPQIEIPFKHQFPSLSAEITVANKSIRLSYGLGWGLYFTPHGKAFFKEGHDDGWRNYAVCFPDAKLGILIMTNSSNGEGIYKELLETLQRNTYTPIEWEGFTPYSAAH